MIVDKVTGKEFADERELLAHAVRYLICRQQTDPDLQYCIGWGTESFRLLCLAYATHKGLPVEEVEKQAREDQQPPYRKREPEILRLRKELEALRQ